MRKIDRTGERFNTKYGECVIVEYNNCNNIVVEFQDEHKARVRTTYSCLQRDGVRNPYFVSVYGVGYIGEPLRSHNDREIRLWRDMLRRCYSDESLNKNQTYKDCKVCERWLCFANFLEDLPLIEGYELWRDNPNQRIALDKDIKSDNKNKIYCLEECMFVTQTDNSRQSNKHTDYTHVRGDNNYFHKHNHLMKGELNGMYGRKHSEESRRKMSESKKGKYSLENNPKARKCFVYTTKGEFVGKFNTFKEASVVIGCSASMVSLCVNGKIDSAKGYICTDIEINTK